jgi:G2/mitotic-specific cyclin-B, other
MNNVCQIQASCGIVLKDLVVNIDTADKDNELAVTEYVDDIYAFYKLSEVMFYALL